MAVSRELVIKPTDIRVCMSCTCGGEAVLSLNGEYFPEKCPSCGEKLSKATGESALLLKRTLRVLEKDSITLRVYETDLQK